MPYPRHARRTGFDPAPGGRWPVALEPEEIRSAIADNAEHLGVEVVDVVNLRVGDAMGPVEGSIAGPLETMAQLLDDGLVRHVGVSNVTDAQLAEAQAVLDVACVQNGFNVASREAAPILRRCEREGIQFVPFFPLGGFKPVQSEVLDAVAARQGATSRQVAIAWLLQHSPVILVIAGTSKVAHLADNVAAAALRLSEQDVEALDGLASA